MRCVRKIFNDLSLAVADRELSWQTLTSSRTVSIIDTWRKLQSIITSSTRSSLTKDPTATNCTCQPYYSTGRCNIRSVCRSLGVSVVDRCFDLLRGYYESDSMRGKSIQVSYIYEKTIMGLSQSPRE